MADELQKAEEVKNDFISQVSHELRTPLTAIKGWGETVLDADPVENRDTVERGIHVILSETDRLSGKMCIRDRPLPSLAEKTGVPGPPAPQRAKKEGRGSAAAPCFFYFGRRPSTTRSRPPRSCRQVTPSYPWPRKRAQTSAPWPQPISTASSPPGRRTGR